jgi:hypothetical protein
MKRPLDFHRRALVVVMLAIAGCFGHSVKRPDANTVIENLGANRYEYRLTRLREAPLRGPAAPVLALVPSGATEIGLIEVSADYSGSGPGGLRDSEAAFYPMLASIAGAMGGTHFMVLRKKEQRFGVEWIETLTVDVLDAPSPPSNE